MKRGGKEYGEGNHDGVAAKTAIFFPETAVFLCGACRKGEQRERLKAGAP